MSNEPITAIAIPNMRTHQTVMVPIPYRAGDLDGLDVRAYIATNWMTVTAIDSVRVAHRPRNYPDYMPVAHVHVDNNSGEPFVTDVDAVRGFMSVIPTTSKA